SLLSVYLSGYLDDRNYRMSEFIFWIVGQISFFQFYNPEFMREFGTGVLNGSLWTISVELQFYIMVPILYWLFGFLRAGGLLFIILVFMVFYILKYALKDSYGDAILFKLYSV